MAEYKRWMAYLYNYENGFKRNCIGTARIERRGIEARTTVSIQVPSLSNERLKTFYYVRTKDGIRGIEVGEFTVNGTLGSWQVSMNANDMAGTGMRLENMDGFLICRDSSKYYASSWDERPVLPSEVHAVLQDYEQVRRAREASAGQNTQQQTGVAGVQHTEQRENSIRRESLPNEVTGSMQNKTTGSMQNEATGYLPTGRTEDMSARASESLSEGMDPGISNKTDRNMQMEINRRMSTEATENMPTGTGRSMQSEINRRMSTEATKNMPAGTTESIPTGEANEIHNDDITARQPWYDYSTESRETADDWRSYRTEEDNRERSVGQPSYPLDNTNQTEQIPDRVTESRTDRTTEGIPNRMTESRTDRATESTPDGTTGSRTDRASESILDRTTESRTDRATENIPDRIVGSMSTETNGSMSVHTDMAKRIFESCPVIWPFSDPWADRCVKLELEDIGLLPVKLWQLTANSFLMHSYYGYRHLVLARKTESGRQTYELLVPGIYNERERELAELFGFRNFRCAKSRPVNVGEYGYWSMPVEFD